MSEIFLHCLIPYYDHEGESFDQYKEFCNRISKKLNKYFPGKSVKVILNHAWEITNKHELESIYNFFKKSLKNHRVFLIYSTSYDGQPDIPEIINYDFFQNMTYNMYYGKHHKISEEWNSTDNFRGLFLTGKPNKAHRVIPLKYFYENDFLKNNLEWSFHYNDLYKDYIANTLNLDDQELLKFLQVSQKTPDNVSISNDGQFNHNGFPYDEYMYKNTNWSIVSETFFENQTIWITEKTYRSILNKHPYVIFGPRGILQRLKHMGYRTFDYCMKYTYDDLPDDERMETILENIHCIKDNWESIDKNRLNSDIEFNFNILKNNSTKDHKRLVKKLVESNKIILADLTNIDTDIKEVEIRDLLTGKQHLVFYNWFGESDPFYGDFNDLG